MKTDKNRRQSSQQNRTGKSGLTTGRKIRDVITPFIVTILLLILADVVVILTAGFVSGVYDPDHITETVPSASIISTIVFYVLTIFMMRRYVRFDQMRFGRDEHIWSAGKYILATVTAVCWGSVVSCLIGYAGLDRIFTRYGTAYSTSFAGRNIILLILSVVILGPLCEEIVFRGIIYRRARLYTGVRPGAVISSLLFGLYHGNMIQFIYAFFLGLLLCAIYEKSKNLKVCIAAHAALNLWTIFLGYGFHVESLDPSTYSIFLPVAEASVAVIGIFLLLRAGGRAH
jgi:membrane protease YdiL (CAAX protease family)